MATTMPAPRRAAFAEEAAEVEVLHANLDKLKSLSRKIQGSMSRLEVSGRTVQEAIGPVYGNTQKLQTMNANVDRLLEAIERAREPFDMTKSEERILRSRPERVGLAEYISSMDRTNQALRELKNSNMRSNQQAISELTGLLQLGTQSLEEAFRETCRRDCQPIEPLGFIMKGAQFPRLPSNKTTQLRTINAQVYSYASQASPNELSPTAKVYTHERGQYMTLSLQNLAAASLSTARKMGSADAIYKKGSNGVGTYAHGILGMYLAEYDNVCQIFHRNEWRPVFAATCQASLAVFSSTLRDLDNHVKSNIVTDCYLAYEIVDVVSNTSFELENRTGELKQAMIEALRPVRETAKTSLSTLLNEVRSRIQQMQTLPQDGNTVPITAEVMQRLQIMSTYLSPISSIMRSLGAGGWSAPSSGTSAASIPTLKSFDVGADGKLLFSAYCTDTMDTLLSNLESRSKVLLKGKSVQGVFLANNVAVVDRMIKSSELSSLLYDYQPKIDGWKKKASQLYTDAWKETSIHLLDVQYTSKQPRPPSTGQGVDSAAVVKSMSGKDKDGIKEKFRNFNLSFDELVTKHKSFKMEAEVRRQFGKDVQTFIEPLYTRFWERYHEVDKGKGKYVKYDKTQLSSLLASLS
ncbi:Cullin repeat-like-containing domain protein [Neohortaea acidophila]|uniref:Exocyst complex protein EXO70 n=1 Tax=Neohortaea acidophila TaxID=245834 RepID=A0A6A6PHF1_9PEZI|nr:Cullin repeat-like-containing domain protein [Neohortaea acidophila]KAF2479448.1 Cullin repeat-like-containing domain protein [Neohortaea acidophila]